MDQILENQPAKMVLDGYVTRRGLAHEFGVSLRTVDRWEALRIGPARTTIGKQILYRVESVRDWLKAREQR
jgi:phage terminase Nu1 subunit (DNA packaging protein)